MSSIPRIVILCAVAAMLLLPSRGAAVSNDAKISYHLGLAAGAEGHDDEAFTRFKSSCMEMLCPPCKLSLGILRSKTGALDSLSSR